MSPITNRLTVRPIDRQNHETSSSFIQSEIGYGNYLPQLRPHLHIDASKGGSSIDNHQECENIVLRVEELADLYYHSLWNSFTNDEKYVLFDLAKDRFVNLRNTKVIRILMQKGVIKADDSLQIMNKSFNNFILSTVNRDEEILMEREQERKGSWNTVYLVLVILIFGLLSFVALAQQKLFQNFTLLIGAISSALALLTRFGGLIGSTTKTKKMRYGGKILRARPSNLTVDHVYIQNSIVLLRKPFSTSQRTLIPSRNRPSSPFNTIENFESSLTTCCPL